MNKRDAKVWKCSKCGETLPKIEKYWYFRPDNGYIQQPCRACQTERAKKRYAPKRNNNESERKFRKRETMHQLAWKEPVSLERTSGAMNICRANYWLPSAIIEDISSGDVWPPGTIFKQAEQRFVVCGSGRKWREFKCADYPLDYWMPPQRLKKVGG